MRILLPLFVIIAGILVYGLTCLIAEKSDHREKHTAIIGLKNELKPNPMLLTDGCIGY